MTQDPYTKTVTKVTVTLNIAHSQETIKRLEDDVWRLYSGDDGMHEVLQLLSDVKQSIKRKVEA